MVKVVSFAQALPMHFRHHLGIDEVNFTGGGGGKNLYIPKVIMVQIRKMYGKSLQIFSRRSLVCAKTKHTSTAYSFNMHFSCMQ